MIVCEDNGAVIKICAKGRTNAFRHLHGTHRIATDWIYEVLRANNCHLVAVNTKYQIADMFTKAIAKSEVWEQLLDLAQIRRPTSSFSSSPRGGRLGDPHAGAPGEKKKKSKLKSPKSSESKGSSSSSSTGKEKKLQSKKSLPIAVACLAVSQLVGCGLVLGQGQALEQSIFECGYRIQEPRSCGGIAALSLSGARACDIPPSQVSSPSAPSSVLYRVITEKFFDVLDMEEDNTVAQWSAKLSSDDKAAMEALRNPPDLGAADPASGPLVDPPAGTAAT